MPDLKRLGALVCLLSLVCGPAAWGNERKKDSAQARESALKDKATTAPSSKPSENAAGSRDVMEAIEGLKRMIEEQGRELEAQRAALRQQEARIQQLQERLAANEPTPTQEPAQRPAEVSAVELVEKQLEAVADSQVELAGRVGKLQTDVTRANATTEGKLRQLGNFAFSGDIRLRYEPFFGGGATTSPPPISRQRARYRLRFNVNAKFSDEITGGFTAASGDAFDPISTNQTFGDWFQRKPFGIDKAFVQYNPKYFKPLTLVAGKFAYTWYRTEMTLDNDLNPEGFSQILSFETKKPVLERITLVGFQLPIREVSNALDTFMNGGQFQVYWKLGSRLRLGTYAGFYDFTRSDRIRAAQSGGTLTGSTNSNAATASQFASKFGILDLIARADVDTGRARWPLMLQVNFASNTRACGNLSNITGTPPACDPGQRSAWWGEAQVGQTREARDVSFGYTYINIEREAVLAPFNFSDLRQPTNVKTHRIVFGYQAWRNVTLNYTGLFGKALVTPLTPTQERFLKRWQFDFVYKF